MTPSGYTPVICYPFLFPCYKPHYGEPNVFSSSQNHQFSSSHLSYAPWGSACPSFTSPCYGTNYPSLDYINTSTTDTALSENLQAQYVSPLALGGDLVGPNIHSIHKDSVQPSDNIVGSFNCDVTSNPGEMQRGIIKVDGDFFRGLHASECINNASSGDSKRGLGSVRGAKRNKKHCLNFSTPLESSPNSPRPPIPGCPQEAMGLLHIAGADEATYREQQRPPNWTSPTTYNRKAHGKFFSSSYCNDSKLCFSTEQGRPSSNETTKDFKPSSITSSRLNRQFISYLNKETKTKSSPQILLTHANRSNGPNSFPASNFFGPTASCDSSHYSRSGCHDYATSGHSVTNKDLSANVAHCSGDGQLCRTLLRAGASLKIKRSFSVLPHTSKPYVQAVDYARRSASADIFLNSLTKYQSMLHLACLHGRIIHDPRSILSLIHKGRIGALIIGKGFKWKKPEISHFHSDTFEGIIRRILTSAHTSRIPVFTELACDNLVHLSKKLETYNLFGVIDPTGSDDMRNLSRCGNNFLNSAPSVEIHHCESIKARVPAHRDRLHESTTPKAGIHNDTQQPSKPNSGSLDIRMRPMHSASIRKTSGFSSKSQLKTTNSLKTSNCIHNNQASDDTPVKSWSATSRDLKPSLCHSSKLDPKGNLFDQAVPKTNSCSPKHSKNEDIKMSSVFLHSKPNSRLRKPIALDISSLLQKTPVKPKRSKSSCPVPKVASTLPERVGKQRMNPKAKKLTPLKRMILEDRATRLKQRSSSAPAPESRVPTGIELRTDAFPPLETEFVHADPDHKDTKRLIYKKTPEVDQLIRDFLSRLASYHDRAYTTFIHDPYRQKKSRRLVCGINQVRKQIRSKQLKILIIARDLEGKAGLYETLDSSSSLNTSSPGDSSNVLISSDATPVKTPSNPCRLDGLVNQLVRDARSSQIPVFFSLTRRELRYLCHKPALVSAVGVINWDGAEELGSRLAKLYREPSPPSFAESFHHPTTTSTQRLRP